MSLFQAQPAFQSHWMRDAFLAGCEDYAAWWSMYIGGGEL